MRRNSLVFHVTGSQDLAKTMEVRSDHPESLTKVAGDAENSKTSLKSQLFSKS